MELTTTAFRLPRARSSKFDWNVLSAWLVGFVPIVYLGLNGGGFDPLVHDQVGIAVWWILLVGALVGAFPQRRLGAPAWWALALLTGFVVWTALSLNWTDSAERTAADLARVATFLGIFALALFVRGSEWARRTIAAVAAGIAVVAIIALLSRFHPAWFPSSLDTGRFLSYGRERLSYPLDYWNGLGALMAIGLPLMLQLACGARSAWVRGVAAATLPVLVLTLFLTLSRGGSAAAIVAIGIYMALAPDRLPRFGTLLIAAAGSAILIAAVVQRSAFQHGLSTSTAHHQGSEMLAMTIVVCVAIGLLQTALSVVLLNDLRPRWAHVSRRQALNATVASALVLLVASAALDAPGRLSHAWSEFKRPGAGTRGSARLGTLAGESRYQYWKAALEEAETKPLTGTGSGTFEFWWTEHGDGSGQVVDAHSLYMQTLGELGIVGLAVLAAFLLTLLAAGGRNLRRTAKPGRPYPAAALASCAAFCITAAFDWTWQIPVLPVTLLLLGSVLVTAAPANSAQEIRRAVPIRAAICLISIAAIVAIAIPLASTSLVRQSQADARAGRLGAALTAARSAQNAQPDAATPRLQQALVLESQGNLAAAATAAGTAAARERDNWRNWLVLSRIQAERGRAASSVRYYRRAKSLNPYSSLFTG
jgi:O-Antigen ligase